MSTKSTSRSERRHQAKRIFRKRLVQSRTWSLTHNNEEWRVNWARKGIHTGARCSCHMCASPRSYRGNSLLGWKLSELRQLARGTEVE